MIVKFEKSGIKLKCLTGKGKLGFVQIVKNFKKPRVWEAKILLYHYDSDCPFLKTDLIIIKSSCVKRKVYN